MAYFIFAVRIYRTWWMTRVVIWLLKLLGFDVRIECEPNPEKSKSVVRLFDKVAKGNLILNFDFRKEEVDEL